MIRQATDGVTSIGDQPQLLVDLVVVFLDLYTFMQQANVQLLSGSLMHRCLSLMTRGITRVR
jgi:hypothetical protein